MPLHRSSSSHELKNFGAVSKRAWIKLAVVFLIALIARLLDAAPLPTENAQIEEGESTTGTATSAIFVKDFPVIIGMGPGLAFIGEKTGWSFNVNGATQANVDYPVFFGMDTAINIWRSSSGDSETGIQLLPTAYYLFEVTRTKEVYPYFGMSVGPTVMVKKTMIGGVPDTNTSLSLAVLFRSGLAVSLASYAWFHFEPKFGLLAGRMLFLPQITAAFLF